jgi:hypothetical protein
MDNSQTTPEVYVRLLGEGVDVWRPTPARYIDGVHYVLLAPDDYDSISETWEFPPGSRVRVEMRELDSGPVMVAVSLS